MAKGKTLRRAKKPQKKIYRGGQQQSLDYKDIQDVYASNLEKIKELHETIKKEGSQLYDVETSNRTDTVLEEVKIIVSFIIDYHTSRYIDFNILRDELTRILETYGSEYTSYFVRSLKEYQTYINEAEELVYYAKQIQSEFINKKIHIHLIQQRLNLLKVAQTSTNDINKRIETLKQYIQSTIKIVDSEKEKKLQEKRVNIQETELKKLELGPSIDIVKREFPEGFIPKEVPFIQGCPLGSTLDNKECKYYNDGEIVESVPLQEKLLNTDTSEWLIWFNSITPSNVNDPTVFKRKILQYLMPLRKEDAKYFNSQFVVCEQNGTPYRDPNGFYKFIPTISETPINLPGFQKYYIDSDSLPQAVQIVNSESPILRKDLTINRYFCALNDIDQILSGIKYIETDKDGKFSSIVPFYPNYDNFDQKVNDFFKTSFNDIDTISYYYIKKFDKQLDKLINRTVFNTLTLDPYSYNLIPSFYKNKFVEVSINKYFNPFILPQFFLENGDYFMIQNTGKRPIVFNLSSNTTEKRMVLYPKQICTFIYSSSKNNLHYGYLVLDQYISPQTRSSKVAKYKDTYIFIEGSKPLYDSEHNIISVPNFNEITKTYYEYDDMFETTPKTISEVTTVNIEEEDLSLEFYSYTSSYVTLSTNGNIFIFCDSVGNPLLDLLGYLIPVPGPLHYDSNKYIWYSLEKQKVVSMLTDYIGVVSIDNSFDNTIQYKSNYSSQINSFKVFVNSAGFPLLANKNSYLAVPEKIVTKEKAVQLFLPDGFKISQINTYLSKYQIQSQMLIGLLKIYTQNTQMLEDNYKDISGNMNKFNELKSELFNILNEIEQKKITKDLSHYEEEAKEIYRTILNMNDSIEKYVNEQKQKNIYNKEIDKIRSTRNAELSAVRSKLDRIREQQKNINTIYRSHLQYLIDSSVISPIENEILLAKLAKVPLDIQTLQGTYEALESSYNYIKGAVDSAKVAEELMLQEQTLNILIKSVTTLEKNQISELQTLSDLKNEIVSSELNLRVEEKNKLVNLIKAERTNLDIYREQKLDNVDIKNSIFKIENIIKLVEDEQNTVVVPTVEIVNKEIDNYKNYLEKTIPQEKAIIEVALQKIKAQKDSDSSKELIEQRNILLLRINKYKENNDEISKLLNSLGNRVPDQQKHAFEEELLENFNLVQDIEQNINTNTTIESSIKRINELEILNNKIKYDLQVVELNSPAPAPMTAAQTFVETNASPTPNISAEPVVEEPLEDPLQQVIDPLPRETIPEILSQLQAPAPQIGGKKKKWQTKKYKKKKK